MGGYYGARHVTTEALRRFGRRPLSRPRPSRSATRWKYGPTQVQGHPGLRQVGRRRVSVVVDRVVVDAGLVARADRSTAGASRFRATERLVCARLPQQARCSLPLQA